MFWDDFGELLVVSVMAVLVIAVIFGGVFCIVNFTSRHACNQLADLNPDYEFVFTWSTECLIKAPNGMFVDTENAYQYFEVQMVER